MPSKVVCLLLMWGHAYFTVQQDHTVTDRRRWTNPPLARVETETASWQYIADAQYREGSITKKKWTNFVSSECCKRTLWARYPQQQKFILPWFCTLKAQDQGAVHRFPGKPFLLRSSWVLSESSKWSQGKLSKSVWVGSRQRCSAFWSPDLTCFPELLSVIQSRFVLTVTLEAS